MAHIKPFQAWYYHPKRVAIERVVAPPYDVISHEEARALQARDPHNVIRLILGQASAEDVERDDRYRQARNYLNRWIKEGVLTQERKAGYYLLETSYEHPGVKKKLLRLAFFALLRLEPFERKIVFAHERTHESPKLDRGKLLRATQANFCPVFTLYEDPTHGLEETRGACESRTPLFDFTDGESTHHRLWFLAEPAQLDQLNRALDRKRIFIADGHHRYETALRYADEMNAALQKAGIHPPSPLSSPPLRLGEAEDGFVLRRTGGRGDGEEGHVSATERLHQKRGDPTWNYVLCAFVHFQDPGLAILPIHRLILTSVVVDPGDIKTRLKKNFVLHSVSRPVLERVSQGSLTEGFGFALSEEECYLMELKDRTTARQLMPDGKPQSWYDLDVNLFTYLVLEPLLRIEQKRLERDVEYTSSVSEVFDKLKNRKAVCSFVLRPIKVQAIKEICESGELMPPKSTYFFPKFPSGLLIYRH